jgi:alpha-L-rhamnosidase
MGYPDEVLDVCVSDELNNLDFVDDAPMADADVQKGFSVPANGHALYDFGIVQGGFIGATLHCEAATRVFLLFDEMRERPESSRFCLGVGAICLDLQPGTHEFESMDPYTLRFLRVVSLNAPVSVEQVWVRDYAHPAVDTSLCPHDEKLATIFKAACQTFRTNALDLFTDCMSRERGGYPCDSWFTAKAERVLTRESRVERNFLENYFLVNQFSSVPAGMVPHCYPSDRVGKGQYIPNWAMWLVLQLCDYCLRTSDEALKALAQPRVEALFAFLDPHANECGLL